MTLWRCVLCQKSILPSRIYLTAIITDKIAGWEGNSEGHLFYNLSPDTTTLDRVLKYNIVLFFKTLRKRDSTIFQVPN